MSRTLVLLLLCGACDLYRSKNPNYCPDNPGHNCANMWDGGELQCTGDSDCAAPTAVCDLMAMTCVQCTPTKDAACTSNTPACVDNTCQACTTHTQCDSAACLPDGSCANETSVAYVAMSGSGTACTKQQPCSTLTRGIETNRPIVKIAAGTVRDTGVTTIDGKSVVIVAEPDAKLDRDGDGPTLVVRSTGADVSIYDLEITGGSGPTDAAVQLQPNGGNPKLALLRSTVTVNQGGGIAATGGTLLVSRSTISGNTGGGISISGSEFDISNNFIVQNGGPTSLVGGVNLATVAGGGTHRLDFNTIAANSGTSTVNSGVNCGTVGIPIVFSSNVIFANTVSGGGKQLGGSANCTAVYSDIGPDPFSGTGNINQDPMFANVAQNNFHLSAGSPCKDAADPAAVIGVDIDGDARPVGGARDIGADEVK